MKNRGKYLCFIIIAAQIVCIAAGLWIHRRLVISLVQSKAQEKAWTQLKPGTDKLVSAVGEFDFPNLTPGTAQAEQLRTLIRSSGMSEQNIVTIIDAERRILFNEPVLGEDSVTSLSSGQLVSWTHLPTSPSPQANPFSATFKFPDGAHVGWAYELKNQQGYILFHQPMADIVVNSAVIARSLLAASAIAMFWIFALLALITYMLLTRLQNMFSREYAKL